jgi:hypothetical protein
MKTIRTLKPMLVTLLIYALLLLTGNLLFALDGNLLMWNSTVRRTYNEIAFFMLYGIAITIYTFHYIGKDNEELSESPWLSLYPSLSVILVVLTLLLEDFCSFIFIHRPSEERWLAFIHFPLFISCFICAANAFKKRFGNGMFTAHGFFVLAFVSGGLVVSGALWSIIKNGEEVLSWDLVPLNLMRLLVCCLALCTVYKTTLTALTADMSLKIRLPHILKAWLIFCIFIHLFLVYKCWKASYYPELNGIILHSGTVIGLIFLLFKKKIGWTLLCIPLIMLLLAQGRILTHNLYVLINPLYTGAQFVFWNYFGPFETFILIAELVSVWYFVQHKQIKQCKTEESENPTE